MSERRFTRSAARAVEENLITVKREQQLSARQAQQRVARQTTGIETSIHIDLAEEEKVERVQHTVTHETVEAAARPAVDDLPALEDGDERKESIADEEERLRAKLKDMAASFTLPPLELPPLHLALSLPPPPPPPHGHEQHVKKEEEKEEQKQHTTQLVSVKREVVVKVDKKEKKEEKEVDAVMSMEVEVEEKKAGDSDDEPIAVRLSRRVRAVNTVPRAVPARARRARRARAAVPNDESSSSDSDSNDDESGDDGDGDGEDGGEDEDGDEDDEDDENDDDDDGADGDMLAADDDDVISLSSGGIDDSLPASEEATPAMPTDETDLLLSSTSPATFIAPFLDFSPSTPPSLTDRYHLTLALSSRSRCRRCRENIIAGYPRIGQQARLCTHLITRWFHPSCWSLTATDSGRQRVGGRLGELVTAEERERVRQLEGRLERLDEYEALLARLNTKEATSWKKTLAALEKRQRDIAEWRASGASSRPRRTKKKRKAKTKGKKKATKVGKRKRKGVEEEAEDEEWTEPVEEEQKEDGGGSRVKRERGVKREASGVKREGGVKREPRVKDEEVDVKREGRVKRERGEGEEKKVDVHEEKDEVEQGKRPKRAVKRE